MRRTFLLAPFGAALLLLSGCASMPKNALSFKPDTLARRQLQSRRFDTKDEAKLLTACASQLQDMGFNIDETESRLGVIVASKERSAVNGGQVAGAIAMAALFGVSTAVDKYQKMRVCIVTRPVGEEKTQTMVRVTFQRIVWDTDGQVSRAESIEDPQTYMEFFTKLSKAVFLEAFTL